VFARLGRLVRVALVVCAVALVAGQLLGTPVLFGFVETGSMRPTLAPGDGFVAVPAALAGELGPGDVVVFRATTVGDGGLTTHRIVDRTDRGFVTRGDANGFTDQRGGEPPVTRTRIVAVAWRPGGEALVLPGLGTAASSVRDGLRAVERAAGVSLGGPATLGALFGGGAAVLYLRELARERRADGSRRETDRSTARETGVSVRLVLVAFAVVLAAGTTGAMVAASDTRTYEIVAAEFESDRSTVVPAGESTTVSHRTHNPGVVPTVVYVEAGDEAVVAPEAGPDRAVLGPGEAHVTPVTLHTPTEIGVHRRVVRERQYLLVLPVVAIDALYRVHPWLPITAVDAVIAGGYYLVGRALLGRGTLVPDRYERRPGADDR
jgi:signal peptidase